MYIKLKCVLYFYIFVYVCILYLHIYSIIHPLKDGNTAMRRHGWACNTLC